MPRAYYNEKDKRTAQHLRNVIAEGLVCPGDVDDRDIRDVLPSDLDGYDQVHLFAGIGIWSLALRWAGIPDDRPVWTASCPCQPFSAAGKRGGFADERHLWPAAYWLITQCRPARIYGEQVASADGLAWLDFVSADLENAGYATRAADLCSAGLGAPNIRQRLWWCGFGHPGRVADADQGQRRWLAGGERCVGDGATAGRVQSDSEPECGRENGRLAKPIGDRPAKRRGYESAKERVVSFGRSAIGGLGYTRDKGLSYAEPQDFCGAGWGQERRATTEPSGPHDPWRELEWIACRDGKLRPTQPGLFPLAPRHPGDVGILRASGNAINPYVAEAFIRACEEE